MHLIADNGAFLFRERECPPGTTVEINAGCPGTLLLENRNGQWRFPMEKGGTQIPRSVFAEGENRLLLQTRNGVFPCESMTLRGRSLFPAGFDPAPHVVSLFSRLEAAEQELALLKARLEETESRVFGFTLFGT